MVVLHVNSKNVIETVKPAVLATFLVLIAACGNSSTVEIGTEAEQGISFPAEIQMRALTGGTLNAYITCGFPGGERKVMTVDLIQGTASASCIGMSPEGATFYIEFEFESDMHGTVALANATKTMQLFPGKNNLAFEESDYVYLCVIDFSVIGNCELGA